MIVIFLPDSEDEVMENGNTNGSFHVGGECQYAGAQLSPDKKFYVLSCKGPDHPTTSIFSLPDNQVIRDGETTDRKV